MSQICRASGFASSFFFSSFVSPFFSSFASLFSSRGATALDSRCVRNAIQRPSGDHCAPSLDLRPRVSGNVRPDCVSASQSCETYAFSFQSVSVTS